MKNATFHSQRTTRLRFALYITGRLCTMMTRITLVLATLALAASTSDAFGVCPTTSTTSNTRLYADGVSFPCDELLYGANSCVSDASS
jgi:hypothetical protein